MNLATILNVVIGLIVTWLVLSVAAMYVQEAFAARFHWRSRMLETTIRNILTDASLADQFYNHPLIRSLYTGRDSANKPSYIPANQFAHVLLDLVLVADSEASLIQQQLYGLRWELTSLRPWKRKEAQKRLNLILALTRRALVSDANEDGVYAALEAVKNEIFKFGNDYPQMQPSIKSALATVASQKEQIDALRSSLQDPTETNRPKTRIEQLRMGVAAMSVVHPRFKQTIKALLSALDDNEATGDSRLARATQSVVDWFNSSMDRLTGWYKRRAQWVAAIIGICIVLVLNADSVHMANQLWRGSALREALAAEAAALVNQSAGELPTADQFYLLRGQFAGLSFPVGWIGSPIPLDVRGAVVGLDNLSHACRTFQLGEGDVFGLAVAGQCYPIINVPQPNDLPGWILKFLGLALTGLAVAQGAPFWFDILKKIINVRFTGSNPVELQKNVG
jgi:hypothetical protein